LDEKTEIRAVETVRRIRDEQAESLRGKTDEEIIEFFREAGERARQDAARRSGQPPAAA
jgi:hypothetical protein